VVGKGEWLAHALACHAWCGGDVAISMKEEEKGVKKMVADPFHL
jgi:hypothetical protein